MAPIRVGIIGLNAESGWAASAHLPYFKKTSKYRIVALCNSSIESARASISAHKLSSETKAYGSPQNLADDPDVDLVVCSVRVDRHYETLLPAVKAGKDVFCEWPLGATLEEAEKLDAAARESGSRTVVGLQGRRSTLLGKMKSLIDGGSIGKVLGSSFYLAAYNGGLEESIEFLAKREVGGHVGTIHFGHSIDTILYVLSSEFSHFTSVLTTVHPQITIVDTRIDDPDRKALYSTPRTAPDTILLQGILQQYPKQPGGPAAIPLSYHLRGGPAFGPDEALSWTIYGSLGELKVTSSFLVGAGTDKVRIRAHSVAGAAATEVEAVEVERDEWDELPTPARNVARLYEAFAGGKGEGGDRGEERNYADWGDAVRRHRLIAELEVREGKGEIGARAAYMS